MSIASTRPDDEIEKNLNFEFVRKQTACPPAWSGDTISKWGDAYPREHEAFLSAHYWSESASVNVHRVVGTDHWDYQGKTWLNFLLGGKRMQRNLQALEDNPSYYLQPVLRQPSIHYNTVDGLNFYVGADGNHRTCLAKFFLAEQELSQLHNVTLNHYQVRTDFLQCYQKLKLLVQALGLRVDLYPQIQQAGREDTAGWKMDVYETHLVWKNLEDGIAINLNFPDAEDKYLNLLNQRNTVAVAHTPLIQRLMFWKQ